MSPMPMSSGNSCGRKSSAHIRRTSRRAFRCPHRRNSRACATWSSGRRCGCRKSWSSQSQMRSQVRSSQMSRGRRSRRKMTAKRRLCSAGNGGIGQPKNTSAAVTPHRRITSARTVFFCWRPRMETPRPCVTWAISTVRASCRTVIPTRKRRGSGMQRRWQSSGKRRRRCPAARQSIGSQGCMPTASVWRQTMRRRNTGSGWLPKRRIHSRRMPWPLCCSSRESRRRLRTGWGARQSKEIQRRSMPWADCICWGPASRMTGILPWSCWAGPPHRGTAAPKHWRRSRNGCPSCQRRWQSPGCSTT